MKSPPSIIMLFVTADLIGSDFITAPPASALATEIPTLKIRFAEQNEPAFYYPPT